MQIFSSLDLSTLDWSLVILCAVIWGLSKSGIHGISIIAVPVMAYVFGSKPSTGVVLPMLILADLMAVKYYSRHAQWAYLLKLLPWTMVGVIMGTWIGDQLDEQSFKRLMAIVIVTSVLTMYLWERRKRNQVPDYWWFAALMGITAGFTTMVGNLAGGIVVIYLLAMHLPKDEFIGTGAWFFLIINSFKMPFHWFFWHTISGTTLALNIAMLPFIALGFVAGVYVVGKFNDALYRRFALLMTGLAAIVMLFQ
ncbi:MAG: sulfite exporter TauE/SafE family protein [Saprospiraceae bacterium]|nr:sulfite exporter TauE/SafE family protein [Saprospiraceae bacterium]